MALYGGAVPWWRVVRSDGVLLPGEEQRALEHYRAEGTPLREPAAGHRRGAAARVAPRLDMRRARWGVSDG
jgi:alkylated DNA nucleotide flippase Atl1